MKFNWIWFVAGRYIFKGRRNPLAVLGIAVGVLALIVIIAVMNGFQLSFIESILEISSYHLRVESFNEEGIEDIRNAALTAGGIKAAVPFREFQGLARGRRAGQQAVLVRGLPPDAAHHDSGLGRMLIFEEGGFDISSSNSVLLGAELARRLSVRMGDEVTLFSISGILSPADDEDSGKAVFIVNGLFRTGYYDYDTGWAFINIESARSFTGTDEVVLGLKLNNRFQDRSILAQVKRGLSGLNGSDGLSGQIVYSSWRDYNRSFFGALRTEKLFMFILVGLIFIVVGLNIFQAQRRSVLERQEEIALMRALGGTGRAVRFVFVFDGAIVGFSGATAGLVFGLLIASNIQIFFTVIEQAVNTLIGAVNVIAVFFGAGEAGDFAFFSPAVFYIKEIPSRIIYYEVVVIFLFGLFSALFAALFASRKISKIEPAEVLRYE
ncbi:MAG: ABC transporter permease [Treponema sp.]|nr:ABC transporter permease [Treponema sp.]